MQHSRAITRKSASNLALAFVLLPRPKRDAMSALYAFCREVDDVADEDSVPAEQRRARLAGWRDDIRRACENGSPQFPVIRELQPVIREFHLPFVSFDDIIKGCEMDLDHSRYENLAGLSLYCYRVASTVGLMMCHVMGVSDAAALRLPGTRRGAFGGRIRAQPVAPARPSSIAPSSSRSRSVGSGRGPSPPGARRRPGSPDCRRCPPTLRFLRRGSQAVRSFEDPDTGTLLSRFR